MLAELLRVGPRTRRVSRRYDDVLEQLGPELPLLTEVPPEDIRRAASPLLAEAIGRLREQRVIREAGYDGVYGTVRLFSDKELRTRGRDVEP